MKVNMKSNLKSHKALALLSAAFFIPMSPSDWKLLKYGKIPPNKVEFSAGQMQVKIHKSNNPIIYPLKEVQEVLGFEAKVIVKGQIPPPIENGVWDDDSILRIGFVLEGERTMSRAALFISPDWIGELFALAPKGKGIDKIHFFNLGRSPQKVGQYRVFPKTRDLVAEEVIALFEDRKDTYLLKHQFKTPTKVAGLWLSMDGDVTHTPFEITVEEIKLNLSGEEK